MIFATPRPIRRPGCTCIAMTEAGECCYYTTNPPPSLDDEDDPPREVRSFSGLEWFPVLQNRLTAFIPGNPGAGKSYLAKDLINLLPEDCDILLFTQIKEPDGNFDEFQGRLFKISLDEEKLKRLNLQTIRQMSSQPILLFDDIDAITDKKIEHEIFRIMKDALANGRGHAKHNGEGDIHTICTSHALNDFLKTKYMLENSEYVALFPQSTTYSQLKRLCEKIGLSKSDCDEVMRLGKRGLRRIILKKVAPMYMIMGNVIKLI